MKTPLSHLIATQARIEATKPKPQARGEGIRAVRAFTKTTGAIIQGAIDDVFVSVVEASLRIFITPEFAAQNEAELLASFEFEPMLLDAGFAMDGGLGQ